jgi:hypothetical protein
MRVAILLAGVVIGAWSASCTPAEEMYAGNNVGYRGLLSTDGRDLGRHELEEKGSFGTVVNGAIGSCSRSEDHKLKLDVAFDTWHRTGQLTIDRTPNAEGVDVDFAWSHHFIPKSDCSRFEVNDDPASFSQPFNRSVQLTCKQPGANGDALTVDVEVRGC